MRDSGLGSAPHLPDSHKNYLIPGTSCEEGKTSCFARLVPALSIFDLINFQSLINLNFIGGYFIDT